jgi:hypothetical protein
MNRRCFEHRSWTVVVAETGRWVVVVYAWRLRTPFEMRRVQGYDARALTEELLAKIDDFEDGRGGPQE